MKRDLVRIPEIKSSFLSCEKDVETILRRLFVESQPYSDELKRLLILSTKDCLDNKTSEVYDKKLKEIGFKYVTLDMAGYEMGSMNK